MAVFCVTRYDSHAWVLTTKRLFFSCGEEELGPGGDRGQVELDS
jgi:hypothetical protein